MWLQMARQHNIIYAAKLIESTVPSGMGGYTSELLIFSLKVEPKAGPPFR
jgi:hypothetical protein